MTGSLAQAAAFCDSRYHNSFVNNCDMDTSDKDICKVLMIVQSNKSLWDSITLKRCCAISQCRRIAVVECACQCSELVTNHYDEHVSNLSKTELQKDELIKNRDHSKKDLVRLLKYKLDGIYLSVFLKELKCSKTYRQLVINHLVGKLEKRSSQNKVPNIVRWKLQDNLPQIIDYEWNVRMTRNALERQHLDTAMSWLSTLGGACSALGDYDQQFAERAGKISYQQMDIALRIGDPSMVSRCRLYIAISLIQQCRFKIAAFIIKHEYFWAYSIPSEVRDQRLINMCHGIWTKLKYERKVYKYKKPALQQVT